MSRQPQSTTEDFSPATAAELSRFVRENAAGVRRPLFPAGGRTALNYGYPPSAAGVAVSTAGLNRTIDYPARDMTVTVEAGVRIEQLAEMLRGERQQLPIDVPQAHRATLGGVVATNISGPRRFGYGTLRDYVIGISAVDGAGRLFQAGGRVVKNVAGYDLCKLLVGSLGTLAIVTQVTLKLKPIPEATALVWTGWKSFREIDAALQRLLTSAARPVALEVLNPAAAKHIAAEARQPLPSERPVLAIGVEGSPRDVGWQIDTLKQELDHFELASVDVVEDRQAAGLWAALTEFHVCSDDPLSFKANIVPSKTIEFLDRADRMEVAVQAHAANGIVTGHLPDSVTTAEKAGTILASLRSFAREGRGNVVVLSCENAWKEHLPVFGDPEPSWPLMRRVKSALDPHGVLNSGRMGW